MQVKQSIFKSIFEPLRKFKQIQNAIGKGMDQYSTAGRPFAFLREHKYFVSIFSTCQQTNELYSLLAW